MSKVQVVNSKKEGQWQRAYSLVRVCLLVCFFGISNTFVHAQTTSDVDSETPEIDPAKKVIQQLEQEDRLKRVLESSPGLIFSPTVSNVDADEACFEISNIRLEGASIDSQRDVYIHSKRPAFNAKGEFVGEGLLLAGTIEKIIGELSSSCMGVTAINRLIAALTDAYVMQGYITTRVFIPNQDLTTGELLLVAVEGVIEDVVPIASFKVDQEKAAIPLERVNQALLNAEIQINAASPIGVGDYLNLRLLEQTVENLNSVPSTRASLQLVPGRNVGGTIIPVSLEYDKPWRLALGMNNAGELRTGNLRVIVKAEYDNLLNINDQISLDYEGSIDTNIVVGRVKIPSGLNNLDMTVSYSEFRFLLDELTELFNMFVSASVRNDYLVWRDALDKQWIYGKVTLDGSQRYINTVELSFVGNRVIEGGYRSEWQVPKGRLKLFPEAGKMFWDAYVDADVGSQVGTGDPLDPTPRIVVSNTWFQPLNRELSWTSSVTGQISGGGQRLARQLSLPTLTETPVTVDSGFAFEQKFLMTASTIVDWLSPFSEKSGIFSLSLTTKGGYGVKEFERSDLGTLTTQVGVEWDHEDWEFELGYEFPVLSTESDGGSPQFNIHSIRRF